MNYTLKDLLDVSKFQELLDSLDDVRRMPTGIIDIEGNILTKTAWQDICTKFHRVNPDTEKKCIESNLQIESDLAKNMSHIIYRCPMGLVDTATPIVIEGKHLGNVFTGQLFTEPPDESYFKEQARQYGFDEDEYLEAMRKVLIFSEEQLHKNLAFIAKIAQMLAEQGLQAKRQREALQTLQKSEEFIRSIIASSNDCIKVLDIEGHLLSLSEGGQKLLEIEDLKPYLGLSWADFWKEDKEGAQQAVTTAASGEVAVFHGYCPTVKGTPKWWEVVVSPMMGADNTIENLLAVSRDITERKLSGEALKRSEYFFKESQRSASIGSYHADFIADRWETSEVLDAIFGIDDDYVRNIEGWLDIVHPDDRNLMDRYLREEVISNQKPFSMEYRIIRRNDGVIRWVNGRGTAEFDSNGNILSLMGTIQDITDRKRHETELLLREQALENSERFLKTIIDSEPECIKMLDIDGNLLMMNRAGLEMIDADSFEQVKGQCVCPLITEPYRNAFMALTKQVFQGIHGTLEFETIGLKGRHVWLETNAVPFRNEHGEITALLGITRDITEKKQTNTLLNARIRLNKVAVQTGLDGLLQAALDEAEALTGSCISFFHFMDYDQKTLSLQAWSSNTLKNMCTAEGKGQHYSLDIAGVWVDCVRERKPIIHNDYEALSHKKGLPEGHSPVIRELVIPIIREGQIDAIIGVGNKAEDYTEQDVHLLSEYASAVCDIAMRKKGELALDESEDLLAQIIDLSPISMAIVSMDGTIERINRRAIETFGYFLDDIPNMERWWVQAYPDEKYRAEVITQYMGLVEKAIVEKSEIERREYLVTCKDGTVKTTLIFGIPVADKVFVMFDDLTERIQSEEDRLALERQLLQAQKMESLGVLAGGIAHDFNNLLAIIIGRCSLAKLRPITAMDNIPQIETAAERAAALCQQMLAYAGKANITKSQIHLEGLVDEMVNMTKSTIGKNVKITCDLASDIAPIIADASQIRQVTMNLIINAAEAIGESQGEVRVSLAKRTVRVDQSEKGHLGTIIPPGTYACLEVTDNGCGMDVETQQRIFEPFYTTKFTGRGLGMSAVLGIIKSHNGALQLFSQPAKGTTFKVYLPIQMTKSAEGQPQQPASPLAPWRGNGTILLVEDEEQVICIAEVMLKELGFTVIKAYNGKEGLELYQQNATGITLVVTDLGMPIMDGYALISELKKLKPELPIIISSGFGEVYVTSRIPDGKIAGLINKPYNFNQLRDLMKIVVEGTSAAQT